MKKFQYKYFVIIISIRSINKVKIFQLTLAFVVFETPEVT